MQAGLEVALTACRCTHACRVEVIPPRITTGDASHCIRGVPGPRCVDAVRMSQADRVNTLDVVGLRYVTGPSEIVAAIAPPIDCASCTSLACRSGSVDSLSYKLYRPV